MKRKTTKNYRTGSTRGLILLLLFFFLSPLCGVSGLFAQNTDTTEQGVVINGTTWATRNVDTPGTFAKTPESAGMFYQWNRRMGWNATDIEVENWDDSLFIHLKSQYTMGNVIAGDTLSAVSKWEQANDPCPAGWRAPTQKELQKLCDRTKVTSQWATQNGVVGRKFIDKTSKAIIFLPAAGSRHYKSGTLVDAKQYGTYWSSTPYDLGDRHAHTITFYRESTGSLLSSPRKNGFSVRCVKE